MEQKCFICGLERYRFEINSADGNGFDNHIQVSAWSVSRKPRAWVRVRCFEG